MNAEQVLRSIGYYRLSGYLYPFLEIPKTNHIYKRGSTLNGALSLYEFDREFRLLVFNQIERIEIAVRSAITNILCAETNDVFWISSPSYFANTGVSPTFTTNVTLRLYFHRNIHKLNL